MLLPIVFILVLKESCSGSPPIAHRDELRLPAYAPDLQPDEYLNNDLKQHVAPAVPSRCLKRADQKTRAGAHHQAHLTDPALQSIGSSTACRRHRRLRFLAEAGLR